MIKPKNLLKKSTLQLAGIILAAIACAIAAFMLFKYLNLEKAKIDKEINANKDELKNASNILSEQDKLKEEVNNLYGKLSSQEKKFYPDTEQLVKNLTLYASEAGIDMVKLDLEDRARQNIPNANSTQMEILPIKLSIKCDFLSFILLMKQIEKGNYFIDVEDVRIKDDPKEIWTHDIKVSLKIPLLVQAQK